MKQTENIFPFFCEEMETDLSVILKALGILSGDPEYNYLVNNGYINKKKNGKWLFKFVGIIALKNKVICVLPKYYYSNDIVNNPYTLIDRNKNFSDFVQIVKVIKKYTKSINVQNLERFEQDTLSPNNELIVADEIIHDYLLNGIYIKERNEIGFNIDGEINWGKTVDELQPMFNKGRPIYFDMLVNTLVTEEEYIITQIHRWAVKYCLDKYGLILGNNPGVFLEDAIADINEIGSEDFLKRILERELNEVFVDRNIRLLKLLKALITNEFDANQKNISLFGTKYFHGIWEVACSKVFRNDLENKPSAPYEQKTFKEHIKRPIWNNGNADACNVNETLEPDIICVDYKSKTFFIFDAKYYNIKFENTPIQIIEKPGVSDVTKQILYEHAFREVFDKEFTNWYNCFIFPKLELNRPWILFGSVKFELTVFNNYNKVCLIYLSPQNIYTNYLINSAWGVTQLDDIALKIIDQSNPKGQS